MANCPTPTQEVQGGLRQASKSWLQPREAFSRCQRATCWGHQQILGSTPSQPPRGCYLVLTPPLLSSGAWKRAWTRVLSLFHAPASAAICPNFLNIIKTLFLDTLSSYEAAIEFFVPDPDMKDAMVQLKSLVNTLPANTTENILKFTVRSSLPSALLSSGPPPPPQSLGCSLAPFFWSPF